MYKGPFDLLNLVEGRRVLTSGQTNFAFLTTGTPHPSPLLQKTTEHSNSNQLSIVTIITAVATHCSVFTYPPTATMKLFATLPLALFAGEALAVCGTGTFSGSTDTWHDNKILDLCALNADNVYYCGSSGTTIVHKQSQLMLRAGNVDSTIIVTCDNLQGFYYHCSAYDSQRFVEPGCKGPIARIQSVKEMIKHG